MSPSFSRALAFVLLLVTASSCASAGKRLKQGREAEGRGDFHGAAARYIDALEKDPTVPGARDALLAAWDSVLLRGMAAAATLATGDPGVEGDPLGAAEEYRKLDRIVRDAGEVGVALVTPGDYLQLRRGAFDGAIQRLADGAREDVRQGRFRQGRDAQRRIRTAFEPSPAQRRASLDGEAEALLAWAEAEESEGRFRGAYQLASEALAVSDQLPARVVDAGVEVQERTVSSGLRVLAVLPVGSLAAVDRASLTDLGGQLSDVLELEHWRRPPLFVAVADPAHVRQMTRRLTTPGSAPPVARILDELGTDFGALVELTELQGTERDVRTSPRAARTRDGRAVTYTVEEGRIRYDMAAEVTLYDERGRRLESFTARADASDRFQRARYQGSFEELDLTRAERLLFNPGEERRQRGVLQESMVAGLAADVAEGVYERVVRRIP